MRGSSNAAEGAPQDVEVQGADGHPVHPEGVDHDPHDGEEPEEDALGSCGEGLPEGHAVREPADEHGDGEADESGPMGLHPDGAEQDQDRDQWQ